MGAGCNEYPDLDLPECNNDRVYRWTSWKWFVVVFAGICSGRSNINIQSVNYGADPWRNESSITVFSTGHGCCWIGDLPDYKCPVGVKMVLNPLQIVIVVILIIVGLFLLLPGMNQDNGADLEPGASIIVQGSIMTVDLVKLDLGEGSVLNGDLSADIKRVEYRINGGDWISNVVNGSMWIPLDAANVTSFEVMGLRGDTLVNYMTYSK